MIGPGWLIRMARWARHPPSEGQVKFVLGIVTVCFLLWGAELLWGWPDWLTPQKLKP